MHLSTTEDVTPLQPFRRKAENYLDSWQEIAAYLNREVRTEQRWEKHEVLPVGRHAQRNVSTVYRTLKEFLAVPRVLRHNLLIFHFPVFVSGMHV